MFKKSLKAFPLNCSSRLCKSRASTLEETAKGAKTVTVGKKGKNFEFSDLHNEVCFAECSARGNGVDEASSRAEIEEVENWIMQLCCE